MLELPESFAEFLTWIGTSGVISAILSWVMEHWPWFKAQSGGVKVVVLIVFATLLSAIPYLTTTYLPAGVVAGAEPFYKIIVSAIQIVLGAQIYHYLVNERADRIRPPDREG